MELFTELSGCCPFCGGVVNVIEGMVYDYTLDEYGYPKYLNEENYKVTGYCKRCSKQLYVLPNSMEGYTVYPVNTMHAIMELDLMGLNTRISVLGNKILSSNDDSINPFVNTRTSYDEEKTILEVESVIMESSNDDVVPF